MKSFDAGQIYTFKLITGEEVVAKLVSQDPNDDFVTISYPILAVLGPQGLQMMPGLFSADLKHDVRLNRNSWAMIAEARDDVRNSWVQATTGITPVTKKIITG